MSSHSLPSSSTKQRQSGGAGGMKTEPASNMYNNDKKVVAGFRARMKNVPDKAFVGYAVQYPFDVILRDLTPGKESMWVKVTGVKSPGVLKGTLSNIPWGQTKLKLGSVVHIDKNQINFVIMPVGIDRIVKVLLEQGRDMNTISIILAKQIYPMVTNDFIIK